MHIEARLFEFIAAFFVFAAVLYGVLTALFATGGEEWAGTTALALTGGMALITAHLFPVRRASAGYPARGLRRR